jgi:hypothetical protein
MFAILFSLLFYILKIFHKENVYDLTITLKNFLDIWHQRGGNKIPAPSCISQTPCEVSHTSRQTGAHLGSSVRDLSVTTKQIRKEMGLHLGWLA